MSRASETNIHERKLDYILSKIYSPFIKIVCSFFLLSPTLFKRCNLSRTQDDVPRVHHLYLSTHLYYSISIDKCFRNMKDHSMIFYFLKGFINWISMKRYQWCRDESYRRTAIFKRHILSSFQKTTQRLNYLNIKNVNIYCIYIIDIWYGVSVVHEQYTQFILSVDSIYYLILFNTEIIYRRTLMSDRDGGSRAHSLHSSISIIFTTSIQQYFQKMIDDSHIYHFLKGLLNRFIKSVSNDSRLM